MTDVISTGEAVTFWILGPIALLGGLGMVFARNAVHSALFLAMTMLSLGGLYMAQQAPFLGFVQIIVYTGAVMMLFLFVLMLVGVDTSESLVETIRGQRIAAIVVGLVPAAEEVEHPQGDEHVVGQRSKGGSPGRPQVGGDGGHGGVELFGVARHFVALRRVAIVATPVSSRQRVPGFIRTSCRSNRRTRSKSRR